MRSFAGLILLLVCLLRATPPAMAAGTVTDHRFFSKSLNREMACRVYLPAAYVPGNPEKRFPVIYFLHGATLGYTSYDLLFSILDNLIEFKVIRPVIMVLPDGLAPPYNGSFYTNSALYGNFEDYICQDLIHFADSAFYTYDLRGKRAIMGASMGAYGALKIAFRHQELFIGVAGHSGPVNTNMMENLIPDLMAENGGQAPFHWSPGPGKSLTNLTFSMAGAFSPNLNDPYFVDFPLDSMANPVPAVMERWKKENVSEIAHIENPGPDLHISFDCGSADEYQLNLQNRALADTLFKYGIRYEYDEYVGTHTSGLPFRVPVSLSRFDKLFYATGEDESAIINAGSWTVFPNPASGTLLIESKDAWPDAGPAEFNLMDSGGRVVLRKAVSPGEVLNISDFAQGRYFYLLRYNKNVQAGQTLIIRE